MWNQLDGLTGLLSQKSYLNRTLNLRPEDKMLIVLDLDNFKYINDTYGHSGPAVGLIAEYGLDSVSLAKRFKKIIGK